MEYGRGIYLVDVQNGQCLYHTDHQVLLGQLEPKAFAEDYRQALCSIILPKDLALIEWATRSLTGRLRDMSPDVLQQTAVSMNFHIHTPHGLIMVRHHLVPLDCPRKHSSVRLLLGKVSLSVSQTCQCYYGNETDTFRYVFEEQGWERVVRPQLTSLETLILCLAIQGFSVEETADLMCKSPETVKYYRRRLFTKMGCTNIQQAVALAITWGVH